MASDSGLTRKYTISDGELALFANTLASVMTRDLSELTTYSITNLVIDAFQDIIDEFQALPNDELLRADLSYAVEQRETSRNAVLNMMRSISFRAKAVFGENSAKYRAMSPGNLSQMPDFNLLPAAKQVHTAASSSVAQLTPEGVTTLYLTDFDDAIEAYENAINEVNDRKVARDTGTEAKISKGNELYALVVKYCDYGKLAWDGVSPAKYNDYVIYTSTSPGSLTAPTGLRYFFTNKALYWDELPNATSYVLYYSETGDENDYTEIYSGSATEFAFIPNVQGWNYFSIKGRNSNGLGPAAFLKQGYYDGTVLPTPQNITVQLVSGTTNSIKLTWDEVPSAERYKIYKSIVAVGAPVGANNNIGQVDTNEFIETVDSGHRYYYHVTAENGNQWSAITGDVFIEVN
jgi:hypothetical protein